MVKGACFSQACKQCSCCRIRLYSIASSAVGDDETSKTVSLCVKRVVEARLARLRGPQKQKPRAPSSRPSFSRSGFKDEADPRGPGRAEAHNVTTCRGEAQRPRMQRQVDGKFANREVGEESGCFELLKVPESMAWIPEGNLPVCLQ